MYNDNNNISSRRNNNRAFAGLFLVLLGGIYLLRQLDFFFFPSWLFSWPMILIIVGVLSGIKHNFRYPFAFIMMFLGVIFLVAHIVCVSIFVFWPLIMISIGVSMMLGPKGYWSKERRERKEYEYRMDNDRHVDL
jgi:hypothetical protein